MEEHKENFQEAEEEEEEEEDEVVVQEEQHQQQASKRTCYSRYVSAHKKQLAAAKRKKPEKEHILTDMQRKQMMVTSENGRDFFVMKPGKVIKHPLNAEFITQGFVAYFRAKGQPMADQEGVDFMRFLEQRRNSFAIEKDATVKYQPKRPPQAYF